MPGMVSGTGPQSPQSDGLFEKKQLDDKGPKAVPLFKLVRYYNLIKHDFLPNLRLVFYLEGS